MLSWPTPLNHIVVPTQHPWLWVKPFCSALLWQGLGWRATLALVFKWHLVCTLKYMPCLRNSMVRMIQIQLVMTKYSSKLLLERNRYLCKVLIFTFNLLDCIFSSMSVLLPFSITNNSNPHCAYCYFLADILKETAENRNPSRTLIMSLW